MSDPNQTAEIKLPPPPPTKTINEALIYVDDAGRQVTQLWPVEFTVVPGALPFRMGSPHFRGSAPVVINTPKGPQQITFGFQFPPEVQTVAAAFMRFDECVEKELAERQRQQTEMEKKIRENMAAHKGPQSKPRFQPPPGVFEKR